MKKGITVAHGASAKAKPKSYSVFAYLKERSYIMKKAKYICVVSESQKKIEKHLLM